MEKLAIIVPYRNRYDQLLSFQEKIVKYLDNRDFNYCIIIVEQDNASAFNRGMLLNIGFKEAVKQRCDYVVFHDVDMTPIEVDYSNSDYPVHLATHDLPFEEYFGGITLFPVKDFEKINGFSNTYWGWGFEDDDLRYRCIKNNIRLDRQHRELADTSKSVLKFNGLNAFVKLRNTIDISQDFSIFISFCPEKMKLNPDKESDRFTLFNIPGYDFSILYNSFKRVVLQFFDKRKKFHQIASNPFSPRSSNVLVTFSASEREFNMYMHGKLVGTINLRAKSTVHNPLHDYNKQPFIYLGCSEGNKEFFKGTVDTFALWDSCLNKNEVKEVCNNKYFGLIQDFNDYNAAAHINTYYDTRFIKNYNLMDLTEGGNTGTIKNCEIMKYNAKDYIVDFIPYRRDSKIRVEEHENNGYIDGMWKDQNTRWNQLRFENEVQEGSVDFTKDGLSNCKFTLHGRTKQNLKGSRRSIIHLNVGI